MRFASIGVRSRTLMAFALVVSLALPGVAASTIIVSADSNVIDPLLAGPDFNAGNQVFFSNVLGGGDAVAIRQEGGLAGFDSKAEAFFDSLPGVEADIVASLAGGALTGVDLLLVPAPDSALSAAELAALVTFVAEGHTVFFMGENASHPALAAYNAVINAALLALASDIRIVDSVFGPDGFQLAGIAADPLTAGVMSFSYAAGSHVTGGTLLFTDAAGNRLIAYEVPEPPALLLLGLGAVLAVVWAGWKRKAPTCRRAALAL